jgi:hypothetical protein
VTPSNRLAYFVIVNHTKQTVGISGKAAGLLKVEGLRASMASGRDFSSRFKQSRDSIEWMDWIRLGGFLIIYVAVVICACFGANRLKPITNSFSSFMTVLITILAALGMLVYMAVVFYFALFNSRIPGQDPSSGIFAMPLVTIGVPAAMVASLALVTVLPLTMAATEPLSLKGLGIEIKGPAAQIVLWALCFVVIIAGIAALAQVESKTEKIDHAAQQTSS